MQALAANGMVRVSGIPQGERWDLAVLDMAGRTVYSARGIAADKAAKVGHLRKGVYIASIKAAGSTICSRLALTAGK